MIKNLILELSEKSVSLDMLNIFISKYHLKLPQSYKDFILKYNGGYPMISELIMNDDESDLEIIHSFHCIRLKELDITEEIDSLTSSLDIIETHKDEYTRIGKDYYPFGLDQGGNNFCISMKPDDFGKIYKVYHDFTSPPKYISNSFKELITKLRKPM